MSAICSWNEQGFPEYFYGHPYADLSTSIACSICEQVCFFAKFPLVLFWSRSEDAHMSIVAPSDISVETIPVMPVDAAQDSAQHVGTHEQARQLLKELEDGLYWEQTNKLALGSSMGSYYAPLVALYTEFHSGIHALRFATGETISRPRPPAIVPQQTDALVAWMRAILNSVDEIHASRPLSLWDGEAVASDHHEQDEGGVGGSVATSRKGIRSLLSVVRGLF